MLLTVLTEKKIVINPAARIKMIIVIIMNQGISDQLLRDCIVAVSPESEPVITPYIRMII